MCMFFIGSYVSPTLLTLAAATVYEQCKLGYSLISKLTSDTKLFQVTLSSMA